jgi:hypothetical protein
MHLTREIYRFETGANHLHCLVAGLSAQGSDERLGVQQLPELVSCSSRQRMLDLDRAAQLQHVLHLIAPFDAMVAPFRRRFHYLKPLQLPNSISCALLEELASDSG